MIIIFFTCLTFSGLVILSLSMSKHYRQIFNKPLAKQNIRPLRRAGWILISLTIIIAIYHLGFGVGLATFFGAVTFVGFIHIWLLSYAPKYLIPLAFLLPIISSLIYVII